MPTDIWARLRAVVRARVASFLGIQATKRNGIKERD